MIYYCSGCLSTNRLLAPINKKFNLKDLNLNERDQICWECKAKMINFIKFKEQVLQAQNCIKSLKKSAKNCRKLNSLSKLSSCINTSNDHIVVTENEVKLELNLNCKIDQDIDVVLNENNLPYIENIDETVNNVVKEDRDVIDDEDDETCDEDEDTFFKEKHTLKQNKRLRKDKDTPTILPTTQEETQRSLETAQKSQRYLSRRHHCELNKSPEFHLETYACKNCDKVFSKASQLRYHRERDHKALRCKVCDKKLSTSYNLKLHMRTHAGGYPKKQCSDCGGWYRQLASHVRRSHGPKDADTAYCAECDKQFRSEATYRNHLTLTAKHRTSEVLKYSCAHCESKFYSKSFLALHIAAKHEKRFKFTCDLCGKGYHRRDRLKGHIMEVHEGKERPKNNVCNICGKAFKEKRVLKDHILAHTGTRPHQCAHCPWRFTQRTTLLTHVRAKHSRVDNTENVT